MVLIMVGTSHLQKKKNTNKKMAMKIVIGV